MNFHIDVFYNEPIGNNTFGHFFYNLPNPHRFVGKWKIALVDIKFPVDYSCLLTYKFQNKLAVMNETLYKEFLHDINFHNTQLTNRNPLEFKEINAHNVELLSKIREKVKLLKFYKWNLTTEELFNNVERILDNIPTEFNDGAAFHNRSIIENNIKHIRLELEKYKADIGDTQQVKVDRRDPIPKPNYKTYYKGHEVTSESVLSQLNVCVNMINFPSNNTIKSVRFSKAIYSEHFSENYSSPQYFDLSVNTLNQLEIKLVDIYNNIINFNNGPIYLRFHLKAVK
jgi:hypothetical protein